MTSFNAWWEAMATLEKVYWCLAIPFTLWMIIQTIFSFALADSDVEVDSDADGSHHDHGGGFQLFSVKNFVAFFSVTGWMGIACLHGGVGNVPTILISFVCGVAAMLLMAWLFFRISKLVSSGTLNLNNAVGAVGEVYLSIPALKKGRGKVMVTVQGSVRELEAMTDNENEIKTGSTVKITGIISDEILLVTPIS